MTEHEMGLLHNFSKYEKDIFGRQVFQAYGEIKFTLMQKMDLAISLAKQTYGEEQGAFIVHDINNGEHNTNSLHYIGEAIDGHFRGLTLYQTALLLFKSRFGGIGLYPDWKHKGIHADIRDQEHVSTWVQHKEQYIYDWEFFDEQLSLEIECEQYNGGKYN